MAQYYRIIVEQQRFQGVIYLDLLREDFEDHVDAKFINPDQGDKRICIELGKGLNELENKQQDSLKKSNIRDRLKIAIAKIKEKFATDIVSLKYCNEDLTLGVEDILFSCIKDYQNMKKLFIYSEKGFSSKQFNDLLLSISSHYRQFDKIIFSFPLKDEDFKIKKFQPIEIIEQLNLSCLTQNLQMKTLQLAKTIKSITISNNYLSHLKLESITNALFVNKQCLESLTLNLNNNKYLMTKDCLKPLGRLTQLKSLSISLKNLKKSDLDLEQFKNLKSITLDVENSIEYLSENKNLPLLENIKIQIGNQIPDKFNVRSYSNLNDLVLIAIGKNNKSIKNVISCLQAFSKIAHKLNHFKIDFSQQQYLKKTIMNDELVNTIGEFFGNCNEETIISLATNNCLLDTKRRFDLAMQFSKIKNYKKFILNDIIIYDHLIEVNLTNQTLNDFDIGQDRFPYYLGIATLCENFRNFELQFSSSYNVNNILVFEKHKSLFQPFKKISIFQYSLSKFNLMKSVLHFTKVIPEDISYLGLPLHFSMKFAGDILSRYQKLITLEIGNSKFEELFNIPEDQLKYLNKYKLHLKLETRQNFQKNRKYFEKLFEFSNFIIGIKISNNFKYKDIKDIFQLVIKQNPITYFSASYDQYAYWDIGDDEEEEENEDEDENVQSGCEIINSLSSSIKREVTIISCFNNYLIESLQINPKMVYLDLQLD